jgi:AraC-like DNA-binding protein
MTLPETVLEIWNHHSQESTNTVVLPDGCRDLILHVAPTCKPQWFVTDLAIGAEVVQSNVGERFWGFRLQPGAQVDSDQLLHAIQSTPLQDSADVLPMLADLVLLPGPIAEALRCLSTSDTVANAARQTGVSERTLQRLVQSSTGQPPGYWKSLARVRRAAAKLTCSPSWAELAYEQGYADQAHMAREFRRWFGCTPTVMHSSASLLGQVTASGYV